jgi:hypothetical protein
VKSKSNIIIFQSDAIIGSGDVVLMTSFPLKGMYVDHFWP